MKSSILAGLTAAIPLAGVLLIYTPVRGKALAALFVSQGEGPSRINDKTMFLLVVGGFVLMAFFFGLLSGLVHGWLGMPRYLYGAIGATLLFSVLALVSRQPLPYDKIVMNLAVGGVLGWLVPLLAR